MTCFRSISRLIGSEVGLVGISGRHNECFDRVVETSMRSMNTAAAISPCVGFRLPACLLQTSSKHCLHNSAGLFTAAQKPSWIHNSSSFLTMAHVRQHLLRSRHYISQHAQRTCKTQTSVRSPWQRSYYSSSYGYRRSHSFWDGDNVLYGLIAANLAGFLLWQSYPGLLYRHATVSVNSIREGRVYTLLTSAFSHNAFSHILTNMFTFYFFGRGISQVLGGKKVGLASPMSFCNYATKRLERSVVIGTLTCYAAAPFVCCWRHCWQRSSRGMVLHSSTTDR